MLVDGIPITVIGAYIGDVPIIPQYHNWNGSRLVMFDFTMSITFWSVLLTSKGPSLFVSSKFGVVRTRV